MRDDGPSTDPDLSVPLRSLPSPMREASVVSILRRHEAPNMGPWNRNQGFFHVIKARKHRRVTLIMWKGVAPRGKPFGPESPLQGLMYNSPKAVTLDAAAIRPNSLWNFLQWVTGLALYFLQLTGWTLYVPVTGAPASTLSPMPRQEKWSSVMEKAHTFWRLTLNSFMWARTTSRCQTANWCDS